MTTGTGVFKSYWFLSSLLAEKSKCRFWSSSKLSVLFIKLGYHTPGVVTRDSWKRIHFLILHFLCFFLKVIFLQRHLREGIPPPFHASGGNRAFQERAASFTHCNPIGSTALWSRYETLRDSKDGVTSLFASQVVSSFLLPTK